MPEPHSTDLLLVGAGPVGLYGAYYAGFRGLTVTVVDPLPAVGGQVSSLYPEKSIYDIAGFPEIRGRQLIDNLVAQAAPFKPTYLLGQEATTLERVDGGFEVVTAAGTRIRAGAVLVTAGAGAANPRSLPCGESYLGRGLAYFVPDLSAFDDRHVVVVGGGDSAVDWALAAAGRARSVTLVHRRDRFRAHEHSVTLLENSPVRLVRNAEVQALAGDDRVTGALVRVAGSSEPERLSADLVVAALGFTMRLGPLEQWGLELRHRCVVVDNCQRTSIPGVFAAGDIATHDGKVKLISVGFGEVACAVNHAATYLRPELALAPGHSSDAMP
jgi:thioredoxin reductase (NADPH)